MTLTHSPPHRGPRRVTRGTLALAALWVGALHASTALARPTAPSILCETYPDAPQCSGSLGTCSTCHTSTWPPAWNPYGLAVMGAIGEGSFESSLPAALRAVEALDSDEDGVASSDELLLGTSPGDPDDAWPWCAPETPTGAVPVPEGFDFEQAVRRVAITYCGRQPTYDELATFRAGGPDPEVLYERLHATVDLCLDSAPWRRTGLRRLVDARIRPIGAVGADSPVGIVIGDYEWDYRLFRYVMTDDRDVRELLLADYHVTEAPDGTLSRVEGAIPRTDPTGQPLEPTRRAGMITTSWFFSINTMFSAMPRTTAAQAYRAWLGMDIARLEGIDPIAGEPRDVDQRGVTSPQCAACHSTLDPLSYAFASFEGIRGPRTGAYDAGRPARVIPGWTAPQTYLLGEPVSDVRDWAEHAVSTEAFARNLALMLFRDALGREPTPSELSELRVVWRSLSRDGWSANRLVHRLVDTHAFGGRG
jgi:hypothetical protein